MGIDPSREQGWRGSTLAMLAVSAAGFFSLYALERLQAALPLNPQGFDGVAPDLAFNTAASVVTNTDWQNCSGEATMGNLVQMLGSTMHNVVSAATGLAIAFAMIRAFARPGTARRCSRARSPSGSGSRCCPPIQPRPSPKGAARGAGVAALDAGAHDDVEKPFGVAELMARIRAALRPAAAASGTTAVFSAGNLVVDTLAYRVTLRGEAVKLSPKEHDLLHVPARHAGRVVTHQQVPKTVWGPARAEDAQHLRVFVRRLRRKTETDPAAPKLLLTGPGVGYMLEASEPERGS